MDRIHAKFCFRDKPVENPVMEEEMKQLHVRLYAIETVQRREPDAGEINEDESEEVEAEGSAGEEVAKE
jgi:hypothetical protein